MGKIFISCQPTIDIFTVVFINAILNAHFKKNMPISEEELMRRLAEMNRKENERRQFPSMLRSVLRLLASGEELLRLKEKRDRHAEFHELMATYDDVSDEMQQVATEYISSRKVFRDQYVFIIGEAWLCVANGSSYGWNEGQVLQMRKLIRDSDTIIEKVAII